MNHRLGWALCIALAPVLLGCRGQAPEGPDGTYSEESRYEATPSPDRVVLTWSGDPASSIDVTWRTGLGAGESRVEFVEADSLTGDFRDGVAHSKRAPAETQALATDLGDCFFHTAKLEGLEPETMYAYRVGDGEHDSEWHQFITASDQEKPFRFVYFGDAQNEIRSWWSRVVREANQHAPRAAFMLHAGDLVNRGNRDAEWGEWFEAAGWLNGMIPVVATPGNHEYSGGLSRHWGPQFSFPRNGPAGLEDTVYWFDYQGARIISLNTNEKIGLQTDWLRSVLEDPAKPRWQIVTFHHPVFSAAKERDNPVIRREWRPLLEEHGVDLVLQGHDHAYARSGLGGPKDNVAEGVRHQSSHTVYVVSVSGPKMYPLGEAWEVSRVASGVQLFQIIDVAPEEIRYEARLATGELYDAFTLRKEASGKSELIEQIPDRPPIRE